MNARDAHGLGSSPAAGLRENKTGSERRSRGHGGQGRGLPCGRVAAPAGAPEHGLRAPPAPAAGASAASQTRFLGLGTE